MLMDVHKRDRRIFLQSRRKDEGSAAPLFLIIMTLGFVLSTAFGIWAFIGMQENQSTLDKKVAAATDVAVKEAESAKDVEFAEKEKSPFRTYSGSSTYGSLSFGFPKSWNVYAVNNSSSGVLLDFYGHPGLIPGLGKSVNFAFRSRILDKSYASEVSKLEKDAKSGKISVVAYRAPLVPSELGVFITGEVASSKQGVMVMLPQRDKTFVFWTESTEYVNDFNKIMETVTFIP